VERTERARVCSFFGALDYAMPLAVEAVPILLHLSILARIFFIVYRTIAIVLSIPVGLIGLAYFALKSFSFPAFLLTAHIAPQCSAYVGIY